MNALRSLVSRAAVGAVLSLAAFAAAAAEYPAAKEGSYVAKNFRFHTGEVLPEVRLHYRTVGDPSGEPVVVLHGTGGSGASMLTPAFAGELFGAGQPLDAQKHFIILPDAVGHGKSTKPSDGLKAKFPKYNSEDMVDGQYRLLTEGLGLKHVRLVIGNSMGGMHAWLWGQKYPDTMDAVVPMASQPTEMAARNWMMRRLMIETIRQDPGYDGGNYTEQPKSMKLANVFYATGTNGGTLAYQKLAPTRAAADKMVDERLAAPFTADANDFIYAWESSAAFNPMPGLDRITAALLAINAADDERNPPETGVTEAAMKRVKNGRLLLIPASEETRGHATTGMAKLYAKELAAFLQDAPRATAAATR
ncbi:MAG: Homoserine O-acetyltransferase [uncultured Microvirga sp.]|uniref:Homoserine O-acetyltransferase n=1 Tax=uncultured Microvirga sp. TaxID=412392 RepID=A0A6J4KQD2_9HYPH|nr:MAG: Homoserine O-acetyltransferase [uncultured Microvirga sp.]